MDFLAADKVLGGDYRYNRLLLSGGYAMNFRELSVIGSANADLRVGSHERPGVDQAYAGGFLNLSGLKPGQIYGDNSLVARLVANYRLARMNSLIGTGIYVGGSLETGNAWTGGMTWSDLRLAGSVFLAADTALGPLYLGFGLADRGAHSFYLALGLPLS